MTLREALDRTAAGFGAFTVEGGTGAAPTIATRHARGRIVLWPLASTIQGVRTLITALADGVVPVIIPSTWPQARLAELQVRYAGFGRLEGDAVVLPAAPVRAETSVALALMTSGTTGAPKILATSLDNLDRGIAAIHSAQRLEAVDSTAALLPLAYSYALVNQLLWAVRYERRLVLTAGLAMPADALRDARASGARMTCLVGHQARLLERYRFGASDALPDVAVVNFAGAPFPMASRGFLRTLFPNARLLNNYGCAEAMPRLTVGQVAHDGGDPSWVGTPIGDIELRIAGTDTEGPITFRGSSTSLGELGVDGLLSPHPEWIASGDVGRLDDDGLHVLGRRDQIVKVFGERVSLVEIEDALCAAGATDAIAWLETDASGDDAIRAVVGGETAPSGDAMSRALSARLPRNLWPRDVRFAATWLSLANGKTDRQALMAQARGDALARVWPARNG